MPLLNSFYRRNLCARDLEPDILHGHVSAKPNEEVFFHQTSALSCDAIDLSAAYNGSLAVRQICGGEDPLSQSRLWVRVFNASAGTWVAATAGMCALVLWALL